MRILHTESSDKWGGQEFRIIEQMQWLAGHGHTPFLAARPDSEILRRAGDCGLEGRAVDFHGQYNPRAILAARRLVKLEGIQVADCHGGRDGATLGFCRDLCAVVRSRHTTQAMKGRWRNRMQWRLGCDHAIATARRIRETILGAGLMAPEKISVIGEWAGDAFFATRDKQEHRASVRAEFAVPEDRELVVVVGMLRGDKAQENLILTVDEMRRRGRPIHGLVVGSGIASHPEYSQSLHDLVDRLGLADFISFAGYRDDVPRLTQAADALMITSIAVEAQSRAAPQAFASLTPVIASRIGGVAELVCPGQTGWLVTPASPAEYADALSEVFGHPEKAAATVKKARALAEDKLRIDARMADTLAVYQSIISG